MVKITVNNDKEYYVDCNMEQFIYALMRELTNEESNTWINFEKDETHIQIIKETKTKLRFSIKHVDCYCTLNHCIERLIEESKK